MTLCDLHGFLALTSVICANPEIASNFSGISVNFPKTIDFRNSFPLIVLGTSLNLVAKNFRGLKTTL